MLKSRRHRFLLLSSLGAPPPSPPRFERVIFYEIFLFHARRRLIKQGDNETAARGLLSPRARDWRTAKTLCLTAQFFPSVSSRLPVRLFPREEYASPLLPRCSHFPTLAASLLLDRGFDALCRCTDPPLPSHRSAHPSEISIYLYLKLYHSPHHRVSLPRSMIESIVSGMESESEKSAAYAADRSESISSLFGEPFSEGRLLWKRSQGRFVPSARERMGRGDGRLRRRKVLSVMCLAWRNKRTLVIDRTRSSIALVDPGKRRFRKAKRRAEGRCCPGGVRPCTQPRAPAVLPINSCIARPGIRQLGVVTFRSVPPRPIDRPRSPTTSSRIVAGSHGQMQPAPSGGPRQAGRRGSPPPGFDPPRCPLLVRSRP